MKTTVLTTLLLLATSSYANQISWTFSYKVPSKISSVGSITIKKTAGTQEEAYKAAAKECFQQLTQGKYPGEEKGLDIIDVCANPKS